MNKLMASALTKRSNTVQIETYIKTLIKTIDSEIEKSNSMNLSELRYELPTSISISNLDRKDAQLIIYGSIIEDYENRGFIVNINVNSVLRIKWKNILSENEKKKFSDIFKDHFVMDFE